MRRLMLVSAVLLALGACPGGTQCNIDPYATANAVIGAAQIAVQLAESIFQVWAGASRTANPEMTAQKEEQFAKYKHSVLDALRVASDGVDIARMTKTKVDIVTLMAEAEKAYQDLKLFLANLMQKDRTPWGDRLFGRLPPSLLRKYK